MSLKGRKAADQPSCFVNADRGDDDDCDHDGDDVIVTWTHILCCQLRGRHLVWPCGLWQASQVITHLPKREVSRMLQLPHYRITEDYPNCPLGDPIPMIDCLPIIHAQLLKGHKVPPMLSSHHIFIIRIGEWRLGWNYWFIKVALLLLVSFIAFKLIFEYFYLWLPVGGVTAMG